MKETFYSSPNWCILFFFILSGNAFADAIITGFVTDASNGEKLPYANVYVEGTKLGSATSDKGYYVIHNVPPGRYRVIASYIGYEEGKREVEIEDKGAISVNFQLKPEAVKIEEVKVTAKRAYFEKGVDGSIAKFTIRDLRTVPKFFESDLIKIIQTMPGVVTMHDLSNRLYIRGGSPDENLVLLDGITVYNPSTHLFGLFSTFNPDAVADMKLFSGGFPSKYGDVLSSVIDVTTREGNNKRYTGSLSTGLITSKLLLEGPIPKGSFLLSGRRTYFDFLVWAYSHIIHEDVSLPYYFYDGVGKINFNPSQSNRFTLTGFGGADVISFSETMDSRETTEGRVNWGNRGVSCRWRKVFTPKLYGEMVGVTSNFFTEFKFDSKSEDDSIQVYFDQQITDYTLKSDFSYYLNPQHTISAGVDLKKNKFTEEWGIKNGINMKSTNPPVYSNKLVTYIEEEWKATPIFTIRAGMRGIYYSIGKRVAIDPSLSFRYLLSPNTALKGAMGRYHQYIVTLNPQESFFTLYDVWKPLDGTHSPPEAYHAVLGIEEWIGEEGEFSIDGYYKKYLSLLIPKESEFSQWISQPSESLKVGYGYAAGIELCIKKSFKYSHGWLNYTLGVTKRQVDSLWYFPRYDKRHNFNIVGGATLGNFTLNLRWYLSTGSPYAGEIARYRKYWYEPIDDTIVGSDWQFVKGTRDAYRLPNSHRLDLNINYGVNILGINGVVYLDIINVYMRKNVFAYWWDTQNEPPKKREISILPYLIPSLGINISF
ncbi:MAG: carboxypeptidase-like regulatory domain-containing protein [bacterium]|nr:carboxypeptidase-like regulatory domain-containing protein [bacterium]